jgi:hypothetical protein
MAGQDFTGELSRFQSPIFWNRINFGGIFVE